MDLLYLLKSNQTDLCQRVIIGCSMCIGFPVADNVFSSVSSHTHFGWIIRAVRMTVNGNFSWTLVEPEFNIKCTKVIWVQECKVLKSVDWNWMHQHFF